MTTLEDVARMRLISQKLIQPLASPAEVVEHMTCMQAQDFPSSTASIAIRTTGRSLPSVTQAYDQGEIVRSWPMRGTLFAIAAKDLGWMLRLTGPRVLHSTKKRRAALGLDDAALALAAETVTQLLSGGPLTRSELLAGWTESGHDVLGGRGYHSIFHLAVSGLICQGPTRGKEQCFVLTDDWIQGTRELDEQQAIAQWFTRYVTSHGPVPVRDFLWWTKLLKRDIADVESTAQADFEILSVDGVEHWVSPTVLEAYAPLKRKTTAPILLPGFDEIVLGYGDRRAVATKDQEALIVPGANGVFRPTVVQAGRALGTWKKPTRKNAPVSVAPFADALPAAITTALPALTQAFPQ